MACLEIWHRFNEVKPFLVDVLASDRIETWVTMPAERLNIGRTGPYGGDPQIFIVAHHVGRNHLRITAFGEGFVVTDLMTINGTWVNDAKLGAAHALRDGDIIHVAEENRDRATTLVFHANVGAYTCDPTEQALVDAVRARTDGSRAIYADWLEDRGDRARATFLRIRDSLDRLEAGSDFEEHVRACYAANERFDPAWRLAILTDTTGTPGASDRGT